MSTKSAPLGGSVPPDPHRPRDHHGPRGARGVPPPLTFSLASLPDDGLLTELEVASALRVTLHTTAKWRQRPDHPLRWVRIYKGRIRYRVADVRAFLALGRSGQQERIAEEEPITDDAHGEAPRVERSGALRRAIALFGSQQELADAAGVHVNSIRRVLNGRSAISRKLALAIERATKGQVQAEELILEDLKHAQRTSKSETKHSDDAHARVELGAAE